MINTILENSESRGRLTVARGEAICRLLPGTLDNNSEEDEDGIFDLLKNRKLSSGTVVGDLLLSRQNNGGLSDGINITIELVGLIRKHFIGESLNNMLNLINIQIYENTFWLKGFGFS